MSIEDARLMGQGAQEVVLDDVLGRAAPCSKLSIVVSLHSG